MHAEKRTLLEGEPRLLHLVLWYVVIWYTYESLILF